MNECMNSVYYKYSKNPQILCVSDSLPLFHLTQLLSCLELETVLHTWYAILVLLFLFWWPFLTPAKMPAASLFFLVFMLILAVCFRLGKDSHLSWSPEAVRLELILWLGRALCAWSSHCGFSVLCSPVGDSLCKFI